MFEVDRTFVLVADGARARLFVRRRVGAPLELVREEHQDVRRPHDRERDATEPVVTPHPHATDEERRELEKRAFVRGLAHRLDNALQHHRFEHLVVVAPPRVLGELREAWSPETARKISRELPRDFTHVPLHELPSRLRDALA